MTMSSPNFESEHNRRVFTKMFKNTGIETNCRISENARKTLVILFVVVMQISVNTINAKNIDLLDCPLANENPVLTSTKPSGLEKKFSLLNAAIVSSESIEVEPATTADETWDSFRPMFIVCKASYPITWDFDGSKPPDLSEETHVHVDDVLNPTKTCFVSSLKLLASGYTGKESRTGNYTCKSFDGKKAVSTFRFAHDGTTIFNTRRTVEGTVLAKGSVSQVYIPCPANVAKLNASILKANEGGNFTVLDKDILQKYDPKMGFLLRAGSNSSNLAGKYVCSGTYKNETEVVEVTVSPPKGFVVSPARKHLTFRSTKIAMQCKATEPVEIKFVNQNVPVQHHIREITYKAETFKYGAAVDIFTHPSQDVLKGNVSCIKKSNQEVLWTWQYDTDYECLCNWKLKNDGIKAARFYFLLDRTFRGTIRAFALNTEGDGYFMNIPTPRGELRCTSKASARVNMTFIPCENPVECQIKSAYLSWFDFDARSYSSESIFGDEDGEDPKNATTISQGYIRSGIIKCGVGDYITTKFAIANLETLHIDEVPNADLVQIVGPENNVFVGDKMLFTCMYEKFQIAREAKWAFMYENGTVGIFEVDKTDDRLSYDLEKYLRSSYIKISSSDITALICFAPVWNSTRWSNATFSLNVSPVLPVTTDSPRNCPVDSIPIIILQRNSSISSRRIRSPHLVSNKTLSLYNPVDEIKLICRANYPVQWYKGKRMTNSSKIGKLPCSDVLSKRKVYEAILHIEALQKDGTGNYSCRKTFAESPVSSVYIYAVGDGEATFVNEGSHKQVIKNVTDFDPWVSLPCEVSNPNSKPFIFLDNEDSDQIKRMDLGDNLRYDPKMGFEIDSSTVPDPVTTFVCSMNENATTFGVLITLHKQDVLGVVGAVTVTSDQIFLALTVLLLALVVLLASGLYVMYRKCQEATKQPSDGHQMGTRETFSSYDDVRIQHNDRDNIVDGNYNRFN